MNLRYMAWTKSRIGDEIGFSEEDLCALYGVSPEELDRYLADLEPELHRIWQRVLADADHLRMAYRIHKISDDHIGELLIAVDKIEFRPFTEIYTANGRTGWQLNPADAQTLTQLAGAMLSLDAGEQAELSRRLARIVSWPGPDAPKPDLELVRRIVDVTTFLVEFCGIL